MVKPYCTGHKSCSKGFFLCALYSPTGTMSGHCPLLAEVNVLEGRGITGGPA